MTGNEKNNSDYVPLVNLIGVYFQIRDDLMNLQSTEVCLHSHLHLLISSYSDSSPLLLLHTHTHTHIIQFAKQYTSNKGFAEDLSEGKFSFPVVHGIHADKSNRQVLSQYSSIIHTTAAKMAHSLTHSLVKKKKSDVLQKRPTTPTLKIHTINYLKTVTKSFEYTLSVLANLEAQTRAEIARLGGNQGLEAIMDLLHVDPSTFA